MLQPHLISGLWAMTPLLQDTAFLMIKGIHTGLSLPHHWVLAGTMEDLLQLALLPA